MSSAKRSFLHIHVTDEGPTKRQLPSIYYGADPGPWTTEAFVADYADPLLPQPPAQAALSSPSDFNTEVSCTPLPSTPGPTDEVCYGMLCGVKAQFLDDPNIASIHADTEGATSSYYQLQIAIKRICMLQEQDGTDIALINTQASKALQELDCRALVRYAAYVSVAEWAEKMRSFRTLGKSVCLEIDVYFFGSLPNSTCVGRILSDAGLFLQRPDFLDSSVPYDNPHEIRFPSVHTSSPTLSIPALASSSVSNLSVDIINTVLGNLEQLGNLTVADVDTAIIITELKPHQREAVDFVVQRESPDMPEPFLLFKRCVDAQNRKYYEHIVAGCRQPQRPTEDFGGIIADEMGLGKTLTMISAIVMTLDRARGFAGQDARPGGSIGAMERTRATLVICPSVLLMDGWLAEVSGHVAPEFLKCTRYHGASKATKAEMVQSDIVLTTYATLTANSSKSNTLHNIHWFRIVLDEAHSIRHQQTKQFRAVVALSARHRWCLTGTPIQNVLNDLGALVRFLRVPQLERSSDFRNHVSGPIENGRKVGLLRLRALLRCICLRRTKDLLKLPEPDERIERLRLTEEERARYCRIGDEHRQAIDEALSGRNPTEAYRGLFSAILRLRIFCNSGIFGHDSCSALDQIGSTEDESLWLLEQGDRAICAYCSCDVSSVGEQEAPNPGMFLDCSHLLCLGCVFQSKQSSSCGGLVPCPVCHTLCPVRGLQQEHGSRSEVPPSELRGYGSKLEALAQDVLLHGTEKCIVFSSWKKSIQLASSCLTAHSIPNCVVDGSMTLPERRQQLLLFQHDANIPALLMTLGTGAVGLNLTVASRIHILEPQWNPSVEKQAIGRAMRLGQEKKVTVVRYVVQDTVEQYIQTRQKKKLYLAQLGWGADTDESEDDKLKKVKDLKALLSVS